MDSTLQGDVIEEPVEEAEPQTDEMSLDAEAMAVVGNSNGWDLIQQYIDGRISHYKDGLGSIDPKGMDLAKVGEKFLVCNLVAQELESLKNKVNLTTKGVNESRNPRPE